MSISTNRTIIERTIDFVKSTTTRDSSGHDWWHIYRVYKLSIYLAKKEGADLFLCEMAALLHDMDDWKFNPNGSEKAQQWLNKCGLDEKTQQRICSIISQVSFKGAGENNTAETPEAKVVQDADRLDAIGAIGIARAFAYGGSKNRELYHPEIKPATHHSFEDYKKSQSHTINHFYEKLLLLKDLLNTASAKNLAAKRHRFLEDFLSVFFDEWNFGEEIPENQK